MTQDLEALAARPITSRLREVMRNRLAAGEGVDTSKWEICVDAPIDQFNNECTIIDGAYSSLESLYAIACEVNDRQDRDYVRVKAERDSALAELERVQSEQFDLSDYQLLPKDAGNERIHIGDWMQWHDKRFKVIAIDNDGWLFYLGDDNGYRVIRARDCLHYHEPTTAEDVLREFADDWLNEGSAIGEDELIADCVKKLREVMGDA